MSEEKKDVIQSYIEYVESSMKKYSQDSRLIEGDDITPHAINTALANYLPISMSILSEYQRAKVEYHTISNVYEKWYDEAFIETRNKLIGENEAKASKISVKEIETQLRYDYKEDYYRYQDQLKIAEIKVAYLQRLNNQYAKFDSILITLSSNTRQEMRSLSIENRLNSNPEVVKRNIIRDKFPNPE